MYVWTSESGKVEEEMDKHDLARPYQPEPHNRRRRTRVADGDPHLSDSQPEGGRDEL